MEWKWPRAVLVVLLTCSGFITVESLSKSATRRYGASHRGLLVRSGDLVAAASAKQDPMDILRDLSHVTENFKDKVAKKAEHWAEMMKKNATKSLMNKIDLLHAELCWTRTNLMEHQACLEFLGLHCLEETTGMEICTKFGNQVVHECHDGAASIHLRNLKCDIAKVLERGLAPKEDKDKDNVINAEDDLPFDPKETSDTDGDYIGDKADLDIDGDGAINSLDREPENPNITGSPAPAPAPSPATAPAPAIAPAPAPAAPTSTNTTTVAAETEETTPPTTTATTTAATT